MSHRLKEGQLREVEEITMKFLELNPSITNRKLRQISGVNYDQAIFFFNYMIRKRRLRRVGVSSGTKYIRL